MNKRWILAVACAVLAGPLAVAENSRPVRVMTGDDLGLSATYYPVDTNVAPAVIFLHSYGKNSDEWKAYARLFQSHGIAALTLDLRGHGESTRRLTAQGPQLVDYHKFGPSDYQSILLDINAVFDWLAEQPGIDKRRMAVIGSDIGANLALRYAAFNEDLAALLVFSPGIIYQGVRTDDVISKIGKCPMRIVVAREDGFAFESSKRLIELRKQTHPEITDNELIVTSGIFHGTAMLSGVKGLNDIVFEWLQRVLRGQPTGPVPKSE